MVRSFRAQAFGLDLHTTFRVLGTGEGVTQDLIKRRVSMDVMDPAGIRSAWQVATSPRRLACRRGSDRRVSFSVDADPQAGHLLRSPPFGRFLISADVRRVSCAPATRTPWRWQRFLSGQVLPFAAVLRGLEVLHASAVVAGDGAHAFVGASRAGKTSLATHLVLGGARLLTDDVLALEADGAVGLRAHPGVGILSMRHNTARTLPSRQLRAIGPALGVDRNAIRMPVPRQEHPVPLRRLYVLERRDRGSRLQIEPLPDVDPALLLSATFNFVVDSASRLRNHLEVCGRIADSVDVFRLVIPPSHDAGQVAEQLLREASPHAA